MKQTKFNNSLSECLKNFWVDYTGWGRATRAEYWWCMLFYGGGTVLISFSGFLMIIWMLVTVVPFLSLTVRRLHDTNHSAWNILWFPESFYILYMFVLLCLSLFKASTDVAMTIILLMAPFMYISIIVALVFMCLPSDKKKNKYGKPRL